MGSRQGPEEQGSQEAGERSNGSTVGSWAQPRLLRVTAPKLLAGAGPLFRRLRDTGSAHPGRRQGADAAGGSLAAAAQAQCLSGGPTHAVTRSPGCRSLPSGLHRGAPERRSALRGLTPAPPCGRLRGGLRLAESSWCEGHQAVWGLWGGPRPWEAFGATGLRG